MIGKELQDVIDLLSRLPGLGPRSGRRAALHLLKHKSTTMKSLSQALAIAADAISTCENCGNMDTINPCQICRNPSRTASQICVVEGVADLWAIERSRIFEGKYHVLGGVLSALDGIGPDEIKISGLVRRINEGAVEEVILALNATVDGQTTAHYLSDILSNYHIKITALSHGLPVGGELDYLDDGTLMTAINSRRLI